MRQVIVISDLHLGGVYPEPPRLGCRGFRLCTQAEAIARFIARLADDVSSGALIELVLNGDSVDFLAERDGVGETWSAFTADPQQAVDKFEAIVERDKAVFDALGAFLETGGRVTLLLGNHDIELSFPAVRAALRDAIGVKPRHDFEFIIDGEAYIVGDALIEHGNRYDAWNQIDYDALRRVRSLMSRRESVPEQYRFTPPAGSELVATLMNKIKEVYAFVDLLKPEDAAVVPILLALEPSYIKRAAQIARLWYRTKSHGLEGPALPKMGGDISAAGTGHTDFLGHDIGASTSDQSLDQILGEIDEDAALRSVIGSALDGDANAFLAAISDAPGSVNGIRHGVDISAIDGVSFGKDMALPKGARLSDGRLRALLLAMRALQKPDGFDESRETAAEYLNAARSLAKNGIRYVIFGHTHQPKRVDLGGGRWYLNSGTWADVLRFPSDILSDPEQDALPRLRHFVEQMQSGDFADWALFSPSYIRLTLGDDNRVTDAALCSGLDLEPVTKISPNS